MTREQVKTIIGEGATDEMVNAILNAASADIGKAKAETATLQQQVTDAKAQLATAQETITQLEANKANADGLQAQIDKYRADEQRREQEAKAAAAKAALKERFDKAVEGKTFLNEYTRDGVYARFEAAVADAGNAGKGDAAIMAELISGPGILANPNPLINIPGPAPIDNAMLSVEAYKAMPLAEKMRWANANPEAYARLSDIIKTEKG